MVVTQNQSIDQASPSSSQPSSTDWNKVEISFKRKDFQHSYVMPSTNTSQTNASATSLTGSSNNSSSQTAKPKKKQWRTLKQILAAEQGLPWPSVDETGTKTVVTYSTIDAPPSFRPAKKYSDISGLPASYTDPHTKLNYSTPEEFKLIRKLPSDIVAGYLTLRRANTQLQ